MGTEPQVEVFRIAGPRTVPVKGAIRTNPGPARTPVVESVACPAICKVRAECITAWAQLMEALVAERRPDRAVPPMAGTAAIGAVVHLPAAAIEEGRDLSSMSGIPAGTTWRPLPA